MPHSPRHVHARAQYGVLLADGVKIAGGEWVNGTIVYADDGAAAAAAAASPSKAPGGGAPAPAPAPAPKAERKLTPRCTHGANGMCTYCTTITDEDMLKVKEEPLNKASRFAPRHVEKSAVSSSDLTGDLQWLCTHRPDQMCVNCAPLKKGDKVDLEMLCQHGPGARCTNCLAPDSTVTDRKYITYTGEWRARGWRVAGAPCVTLCASLLPPASPPPSRRVGQGPPRPL